MVVVLGVAGSPFWVWLVLHHRDHGSSKGNLTPFFNGVFLLEHGGFWPRTGSTSNWIQLVALFVGQINMEYTISMLHAFCLFVINNCFDGFMLTRRCFSLEVGMSS